MIEGNLTIINYQHKIQRLREFIQKISGDEIKLRQALSEVKELARVEHLGLILAMYHNQSLLRLLQETGNAYLRQKDKSILSTVYFIFELAVFCLLDFDKQYKTAFIRMKAGLKEKCRLSEQLNEEAMKLYELRRQTIKEFMTIRHSNDQLYGKGLQLKEFIQNTVKHLQSGPGLDQITVNWLKREVNQYQRQIFQQKGYAGVGYCCNLVFQKKSTPIDIEFGNNFFAAAPQYRSSMKFSNQYREVRLNQLDLVRRKAVEFLNMSGGYIYFGIEPEKKFRRQGQVKGMAMSEVDRVNFLKTVLRNVVNMVYPNEGELEDESEFQQRDRLQKFVKQKDSEFCKEVRQGVLKHKLNESLQLEFLPLHDKNLFLVRDQRGNQFYVARIKVTMGDPVEVYYVLNDKQLPIAYMGGQPLMMMEYYNKVYEKLKDQANDRLHAKQPNDHPLCNYSLQFKEKDKKK